ncbi:MAG: hypothetical protein Q9203_003449 [Teloschistes exilis]
MSPLGKRHSWPPFRSEPSPRSPESVDENPFPDFISSAAEDEDGLFQTHLSAGITSRPRSTSLPPSSKKSTSSPTMPEKLLLRVTRLKAWIKKMEMYHYGHTSPPPLPSSAPSEPVIALYELPSMYRGRDLKTTASSRVRNKARTPPRRPRAWRQPSEHLWPVAEEIEGVDEMGLGITV